MKRILNVNFKLTPKAKQQMNRRFYCCAIMMTALGILMITNTFCHPWMMQQIKNINLYDNCIVALLSGCYIVLTNSLLLAYKLKRQQLNQLDRD